jgi:serine O-acetyltransferase
VLLNPCFYSVVLYRLSNFLYKRRLKVFAKIIWFINRVLLSIDIDYRAEIGESFIIVHGIGIVIGYDVKIGNNVMIYHGVTLGGSGKVRYLNGKKITQPIIGNDCILYTNSCIFGPVIINANTKIKACSLVSKDI